MDIDQLTARQREVFWALSRGLQNKQIASALGVALKTVEMHIERIKLRLTCDTLREVVVKAVEARLRGEFANMPTPNRATPGKIPTRQDFAHDV